MTDKNFIQDVERDAVIVRALEGARYIDDAITEGHCIGLSQADVLYVIRQVTLDTDYAKKIKDYIKKVDTNEL